MKYAMSIFVGFSSETSRRYMASSNVEKNCYSRHPVVRQFHICGFPEAPSKASGSMINCVDLRWPSGIITLSLDMPYRGPTDIVIDAMKPHHVDSQFGGLHSINTLPTFYYRST